MELAQSVSPSSFPDPLPFAVSCSASGQQTSAEEAGEHEHLSELIAPELRDKAHERFLLRLVARAGEERCTAGECGDKGGRDS